MMDARSKSLTSALLCAITLQLAALLVHPVMEAEIMGDASYTRTAEVFARTGHIAYNGSGAMPIGWQLDMSAIAIKVLGFSMTVVRLSMLPVAMASAALLHRVLRMLAIGIPVLLAGVAFIIVVMRWFAARPYTIPEA